MVEGKVILFLSFFHMEKQRAEKRREKEGEGGVCQRSFRVSMGESELDRNLLNPLPLLCEHPPSLQLLFSDLAQVKAGSVLSQGWFQGCSTAVCH